jgi:hypothetical protein
MFTNGEKPLLRSQREFAIKRLQSGGVITNYYCTSKCGHCLYGGSPRWQKDYIDKKTMSQILGKVKTLGCDTVHIGGGEPFLDLHGLRTVLEMSRSEGVHVEYVETNSSWYRDHESACETLNSLKDSGLSTLLISMSPFHNEHIPFYKVKGTLKACQVAQVNVIPWIAEFYHEIDHFDDGVTHTLSEYEERYGRDYLARIPGRYWIHFGGRALKTYATVYEARDYASILSANKGGCRELMDVSHFHIDLFGNYIPGLCSGLAVNYQDLGKTLLPEQYPILCTLFRKGVQGFFDLATDEYGFQPTRPYLSKCDLCFDIRRHIVSEERIATKELQPEGFYEYV